MESSDTPLRIGRSYETTNKRHACHFWVGGAIFPIKVNGLGGTLYAPLVISIELLQGAVLLLCGIAVALIGGTDRWQKVCVAMATMNMLIIGVMVQR